MTEHIKVENPDAAPNVRVIRLDRPDKKNAITREMYAAMAAALKAASADASVHVVVFLGQPGCFSAGNDMADFLAFATQGAMGRDVLDFLTVLATFDKPLVSGVDGVAIGIGTTIHLHCDLTLASERSIFRTPFVDLALVPEAASSLIVPQRIGYQHAFALLAAGEPLSAAEACREGLIWKVVSPDALEQETLAAASRLAVKPQGALRIARDLLRGPRQEILARIAEEARHFEAQLGTAEARSAFETFLKR